eukprot:m.221918 g.221918  ORF g.221918 m.221918 type:complete len:218 (+) comp15134_c0_seq9:689-1342(+)
MACFRLFTSEGIHDMYLQQQLVVGGQAAAAFHDLGMHDQTIAALQEVLPCFSFSCETVATSPTKLLSAAFQFVLLYAQVFVADQQDQTAFDIVSLFTNRYDVTLLQLPIIQLLYNLGILCVEQRRPEKAMFWIEQAEAYFEPYSAETVPLQLQEVHSQLKCAKAWVLAEKGSTQKALETLKGLPAKDVSPSAVSLQIKLHCLSSPERSMLLEGICTS